MSSSPGGWTLHEQLGAGGMGSVYRATRDGQSAALKMMHAALAADPEFRRRFRREAVISQLAQGDRVARVIGFDADGPTPWLATELLDGTTLAAAVREAGPLHGEALDAVAIGVADGIVALHSEGILHRDIKPANVMLTSRGSVLVDFGIAAAAEMTALTRTGVVLGSAGWMAPEQVNGRAATGAADVFAWAASIAYAATGRHPFGTGHPEALVYRVTHDDADLDGIEPSLARLLQSALAKDPAERPAAKDLPRLWTQARADHGDGSTLILPEPQPTAPLPKAATRALGADGFDEPDTAVLNSTIAETPRRRMRPSTAAAIALGALVVAVVAGAIAVSGVLSPQERGAAAVSQTSGQATPSTSVSPPASAPPSSASAPLPAPAEYRATIVPGNTDELSAFSAWLMNHVAQRVVLDITWSHTTDATFELGSTSGSDIQADMLNALSHTCASSSPACGLTPRLYVGDVASVRDATFSGNTSEWYLSGTFVVQSVTEPSAGSYLAHLRPVQPAGNTLADPEPVYSDCGLERPQPRPTDVTLTCADGGLVVTDISWSYWNQSTAEGQGTVIENDCRPDCVDGRNQDYPVAIELDDLAGRAGLRQFHKATLIFLKNVPTGFQESESFTLATR